MYLICGIFTRLFSKKNGENLQQILSENSQQILSDKSHQGRILKFNVKIAEWYIVYFTWTWMCPQHCCHRHHCLCVTPAIAHVSLSPLHVSPSLLPMCHHCWRKPWLSPKNVVVSQEDPLCGTKSANIQAKRKERKTYCLPQYVSYNT
jgi:hypothetical protein